MVRVVSTADEALKELEEGIVDCMVVGLGMPEVDAVALMEQVKGMPDHHDLPIVAYSNRSSRSPTSAR
jgi:CheY-like chemotaxis protein